MGKRRDQMPVILTVLVQESIDKGVVFYQEGHSIYIAKSIPPGCFSGPPLPKQKPETKKPDLSENKKQQLSPGSFILEFDREKEQKKKPKHKSKKKDISWKNDKKKIRKQTQKRWPS